MKSAMSRIGSVKQVAVFLSPLIGGLIVRDLTQDQFNLAISLTVITLFIGVIVSLSLQEPEAEWETERANVITIFRDGVTELTGNRRLQRLVLLVVLTTPFTGMMVTTLIPPFFRQWEVSPFLIGLAMSLGNLLAAFTLRFAVPVERRLGRRWGIAALTLLPGLGYLVLAVIGNPIFAWLLVIWMYGTNDMRSPLISAYQNEMIASRSRATVLSLINMLLSLFIALLMPLYAGLASQSLPLAFVVIGGVILTAGILLRVDRLVVV